MVSQLRNRCLTQGDKVFLLYFLLDIFIVLGLVFRYTDPLSLNFHISCEMWNEVLFFTYRVPIPLVKDCCIFTEFCTIRVDLLRALCSHDLFTLSVLMSHCHDGYSFVSLKVRQYESFNFVLLFQNHLGYSSFSIISLVFKYSKI